jgi:Baseplate hub gp41
MAIPSTTLNDVNVTAKAPVVAPQFNPFTKRVISLTFQLNSTTGASNTSFENGANTLTVTGLRTYVQIQNATLQRSGGVTGTLYLRVQGLTLDHINALTVAGTTYLQQNNTVKVEAGDIDGTLTTVFVGKINYAYPDFSAMPDVAFVVQAASTGELQLKPTTPVSFPGPVSVTQALTQILQPAGITLQNNGGNATLASPYFPGTVWQQVQRIVKHANANAWFDPIKNVLIIWPTNGSTASGATVLISPQTGMIGYPAFQKNQIVVRTIFAPNTLVGPSQTIQVKSQLKAANGMWNAYTVVFNLSSETPGGPWEMVITAYPLNPAG